MKKLYLLSFIVLYASAFSQNINKHITVKDVTRIIKTLSADDMKGRSTRHPDQIEKAARFIEDEFKKTGLQPLTGLATFRQEFTQKFVRVHQADIRMDDDTIAAGNIIIISNKTEINYQNNLRVKSISSGEGLTSTDQHFFNSVFNVLRDTIPSLVIVDEAFRSSFEELRGMYRTSFINNKRTDTIFILGKNVPSSYSIHASQKIDSLKMTNVVGMLKGRTRPEEMIIFSGHYDHLGIQSTPVQGDSIANGADDDASGTTAVIELARYFKSYKKNDRTLIFVAFTAEEIGGYGSKFFSSQLNPDQIVAMFNFEMIGKLSKWGPRAVFITGYNKSDLGAIMQKNLSGSPYQLHPDPYPEQDLFYRSDNATLARLGVPAHSISTDQIPTDRYYHTVDDEFETLDIVNMTDVIRAIAVGCQTIVEGKDTPARINKSTIR